MLPNSRKRSKVSTSARKTRLEEGIIYEQYPETYAVVGLYENLKFALQYEPIDLGIIKTAGAKIERNYITDQEIMKGGN